MFTVLGKCSFQSIYSLILCGCYWENAGIAVLVYMWIFFFDLKFKMQLFNLSSAVFKGIQWPSSGWDSALTAVAWVQSLSKLRSHKPHGMATHTHYIYIWFRDWVEFIHFMYLLLCKYFHNLVFLAKRINSLICVEIYND